MIKLKNEKEEGQDKQKSEQMLTNEVDISYMIPDYKKLLKKPRRLGIDFWNNKKRERF